MLGTRAPRSAMALGLTMMMFLPALGLGLAAPADAPAPAPAMDVPAWAALAAAGQLPTACDAAAHAVTLDLPEGVPLPAGETDAINPLEACPGLRPGARTSNVGCTLNFVFTDGASLYIGTAGHCTNAIGQRMSAPNIGAFGSVVYRINGGIGNDFALIRVDADKVAQVNPAMCTWGGPTGTETAGGPGNVLLHYGWGFTTSATPVTRMRVQVATAWDSTTAQFWGWGSGGDSGSPLINQNGEAYAILTHGAFPFAAPILFGTTVPRAISLANAAGFNIQVVPGAYLPLDAVS